MTVLATRTKGQVIRVYFLDFLIENLNQEKWDKPSRIYTLSLIGHVVLDFSPNFWEMQLPYTKLD